MIFRSGFVQIRKHPPLSPFFKKHGIRGAYAFHDDCPQLPFHGEFRAAVDSDLPRFARLRAHVKRPLVLEQERERQVEWFFDGDSTFDYFRSTDFQRRYMTPLRLIYKILDKAECSTVVRA